MPNPAHEASVQELCIRLGRLLTRKQEKQILTGAEWHALSDLVDEINRRARLYDEIGTEVDS